MRALVIPSALALLGILLASCNVGSPQGVLPRTDLPPPPSVGGGAPTKTGSLDRAAEAARRQAIKVPERLDAPRPSSPAVEPVLTGSGVGAGFRF